MVPKICITGGPCGGKTSALAFIIEWLMDHGYYPIVVPEAYTYLKTRGLLPSDPAKIQSLVIKTTIWLEDQALKEAMKVLHLNPIIICDRGVADSAAYSTEAEYVAALRENGISSLVAARDERYHTGVFHMLSAAKGAEQFYTLDNNTARHETIEEARVQDDRTQDAWTGTVHMRIIDNSTDFAGKLARLKKEICGALGIPVPREIERKFLCKPTDPTRFSRGAQPIDIEQVYLMEQPGLVPRIRKRGQHGAFIYIWTEKRFISHGVNDEKNKLITLDDYTSKLPLRNPKKGILRKTRTCFVFEHQYFEFDKIPLHSDTVHLLELELTEESQKISLPPFMEVIEEVTDKPEYSNAMLAEAVL